jgi:hypothetical protein
MLAEVGELLVHVTADVAAVNQPHQQTATFIYLPDVWQLG